MLTDVQVPKILEDVRTQLDAEARKSGVKLLVPENGSKLDDGWLFICVIPGQEGIRASDHAGIMARVERQLHDQGVDNVLLVPTLEE
jgi:hypothetical protein